MKAILLIMIGLSSLSMAAESPRFTKADGVVTDSETTLEWQDDYGDNADSIKVAKWREAIDYCEGLSLNSQDDWRLPNKKELLSIVDYSAYDPAISSVFEEIASDFFKYYWSSTTYASDTGDALLVNFKNGYTDNSSKHHDYSVRCVRSGQNE